MMPGNTTSGSTTCESVGQNSGLFFHSVPNRSKQAPLRISQTPPFDLTIVVHFGHRVCITCFPRRIESLDSPAVGFSNHGGAATSRGGCKAGSYASEKAWLPTRRRGLQPAYK